MTNETVTATTPTDTPITPSESVTTALGIEGRLFANKFKSVEELEKAYGNSVNAYNEKAKMEKELERYTKTPDKYQIPEDIALRPEDFAGIEYIAKEGKFTQEQFEITSRKMAEQIHEQQNAFEERRKAIGEEKLTLINDYVTKHIPEYARDVVLNKLIKDDQAMSDALKDRDQRLNSQVPGMNQAGGSAPQKYDGQRDLAEAARAYHRNPRDQGLKQKYLEMSRDVGHARMEKR